MSLAVESMSRDVEVMDVDAEDVKVVDYGLPWVEKYRPNSLSELIAHEEIINICEYYEIASYRNLHKCLFISHDFLVNKLIESNKLPHLLFYGPPGTGKTSTIKACAKKMFGDHYNSMTLELNASDDRGINVIREQIKEFAGTKKLFRCHILPSLTLL